MICTHPSQPYHIIFLRDGRRHEFRACQRCYVEWQDANRVVEVAFSGDAFALAVAGAEVNRLLRFGEPK